MLRKLAKNVKVTACTECCRVFYPEESLDECPGCGEPAGEDL